MSAGPADAIASFHSATRTGDLALLAPLFRAAVDAAIAECNNGVNQLEAIVFETYRSNELQAIYYTRGRTVRPPSAPVTNAMSNIYSWHGYGLAVDVIHRTKHWNAGDAWFRKVAEIFKRHGCKWGGDWRSPDLPHFQWGLCRASPSDQARALLRTGGVLSVWEAVGAAATLPRALTGGSAHLIGKPS
jgi:peptidoglycan L-alanyl-D-glutamate endopeptidase CwlK